MDQRDTSGNRHLQLPWKLPLPRLLEPKQYASLEYQEQLAELRFRCSMSGVGNCFDNAVVESFFDTLKTEVWDRPFETRRAAHEAALFYIEGFYNLKRQHSTLGYVSPAVFERAA